MSRYLINKYKYNRDYRRTIIADFKKLKRFESFFLRFENLFSIHTSMAGGNINFSLSLIADESFLDEAEDIIYEWARENDLGLAQGYDATWMGDFQRYWYTIDNRHASDRGFIQHTFKLNNVKERDLPETVKVTRTSYISTTASCKTK